ncbi:MAG: serine hydrolase domain-containing protein, partial [Myxococcota bacterium]
MMRVVGLALVVVGCTTPEVPDAAVECDVASEHPRAEALQTLVDRPVAQGVPGIGIAVMTPDGIWQGAAGEADIEHGIAMTPCHVHSWESIGKTWFAALALRLAEVGELELDGRAAGVLAPEVVEGLANVDRATFRDLLQHVTGLPDFNEDLGYLGNELDDPIDDDTPRDLLDFVRGQPAHFAIGEGYRYSDSNFVLVALAADALRGDRSQAMRDEVFAPLGLTHTWAPRPGDPAPQGRVASYWEVAGSPGRGAPVWVSPSGAKTSSRMAWLRSPRSAS